MRTLLLAPLAGALVFASPALAQADGRPGASQPYAEDSNADDEDAAQQREFLPERGRYAYRLDDDRDTARDQRDRFERFEPESGRPDDRMESGVARDFAQREQPAALLRRDDRQGMDRNVRDQYESPRDPSRDTAEEGEGNQPQPGVYPQAPIHWDDRDQGADAPAIYRSEPSLADREGTLPQHDTMVPAARVMSPSPIGHAYPAPRRDHSSAEAIWHVRAALNVAALNCRDANESRTVAAYNRLLSAKRTILAVADIQTKALYRARFGQRWEDMHDTEMTKLYNFFAQPPAHDDFCRAAEQVLDEALTVPNAAFADFANDALARLEAPFTNSSRRADGSGSWRRATS